MLQATISITLLGKFADGSVLDVTHSSHVVYTTSNATCNVNTQGIVTAIAPGDAVVTSNLHPKWPERTGNNQYGSSKADAARVSPQLTERERVDVNGTGFEKPAKSTYRRNARTQFEASSGHGSPE